MPAHAGITRPLPTAHRPPYQHSPNWVAADRTQKTAAASPAASAPHHAPRSEKRPARECVSADQASRCGHGSGRPPRARPSPSRAPRTGWATGWMWYTSCSWCIRCHRRSARIVAALRTMSLAGVRRRSQPARRASVSSSSGSLPGRAGPIPVILQRAQIVGQCLPLVLQLLTRESELFSSPRKALPPSLGFGQV